MQEAVLAQALDDADKDMDRDWLAVAASAVGLVLSVGTLSIYTFGVFVKPLTAEFGWSRTELFGALAVSQYAMAVTSPAWGALMDRFGPRRLILSAIVMLSLLIASLALLQHSLLQFYLVFFLFPLGCATGPLGYSAVIVHKFNGKLGQALGLALMGVGLGAFLLPPIAQAFVSQFGWRGAYALLGLVTLVVTAPAALIATRGLAQPVVSVRAARTRPLTSMLLSRAFILMCVLFILIGTISVGALAHLVPLMTDRGLSGEVAARVAATAGLATLIGRGGLGWILDRVNAAYVLAVVAVMAMIAFLLFAFAQGLVIAYIGAALVGLVVGAEVDFVSFLTRRYFGMDAYGRLYGVAFGLFIVGSGTGPLLLGACFERFGGYRPGMLLFAALALLVVVLAFALPAYDRPETV